MNTELVGCASKLRDLVANRRQRLVFVESCTGGWLAASMASLPGISQWWCGSLVVYRCGSKQQWLDISAATLDDPNIGPVSEIVTSQLAQQALVHTPEADISIAVTGDLGPGVEPHKDGILFTAIALRRPALVLKANTKLKCPPPESSQDIERRVARLHEASQWVFETAVTWIGKNEA